MIASVGLRIYNLVEPHVAAGFPDYILADLPLEDIGAGSLANLTIWRKTAGIEQILQILRPIQ